MYVDEDLPASLAVILNELDLANAESATSLDWRGLKDTEWAPRIAGYDLALTRDLKTQKKEEERAALRAAGLAVVIVRGAGLSPREIVVRVPSLNGYNVRSRCCSRVGRYRLRLARPVSA